MTTSQAPLPGTAAAGKGLNLLGLIRQNKAKLDAYKAQQHLAPHQASCASASVPLLVPPVLSPVTNQQSRPEPTPPVEGLVKPELPIPTCATSTTPTPTHPTPPARPHITSILKRPRSSHTNDNFTRWTCQHSRRISILLRRDNQAEEHAAPVAGPSQVKKVEVEKEGDALKSAGLALRERLKKGWVNPTLPSAAAPEKGKGKEKEGVPPRKVASGPAQPALGNSSLSRPPSAPSQPTPAPSPTPSASHSRSPAPATSAHMRLRSPTPTPHSRAPSPSLPPPALRHLTPPPTLVPARDDSEDHSTSSPVQEQEAEYEVECILASEKRRSSPSDPKKQRWYLVKWAGYPEEEATWEPRENVRETVALDEWIRGKKEKRERDEEEEQKPVKRRRVK